MAGSSHISQSPFQASQAQNGQGSESSATAQSGFPQLDSDQQLGQLDWAAFSKMSELQQLQLTDQLRLLEAQASLG